MILISACLLGRNVKYSGGNNLCPWLAKYYNTEDFTAFCPECLAMLPPPAGRDTKRQRRRCFKRQSLR